METVPYLGHEIRRWTFGASTFLAWPEAGARLMNWHFTRQDGSVRDVVHWPELDELGPIEKVRGGNPILFPFCARVFDSGEIHFWRDQAGNRHPMPMHGFARQGLFELTDLNERGFTAVLQPTEQDRVIYPFDYEFAVTYRFGEARLACEFALTNQGTTSLPWSAGHHFYFAVPWNEGESRQDYVITLPPGKTARQTDDGNLAPGPKLPRRCPLSEPALVDTFHVDLKGNSFRFGPRDNREYVAVSLGEASPPADGSTFVTWSAAADAPYYCVEPWMGPANAPGHGHGLHHVPPGLTQHFSVEVSIG